MKKKFIFLLSILNSIIFNFKPILNAGIEKNINKNQMQMPMISEDELKEIIKNEVEKYKKLPYEEKEKISKEIGISTVELDEIMKEAATFVQEIESKNNKNDTFSTKETISNNIETTMPNKNTIIKNEINEQKNIIEESIKTLEILLLKTNDVSIREKIINDYDYLIPYIEKTLYYFSLIKQFLINNNNELIIKNEDINKITSIAIKINILTKSIEKLITKNEYEITNNKNNLFQKYNMKTNSFQELKNFLENEIKKVKNNIENITKEITQNESEKKEKTKKIINLEYKIDNLEKDLLEASFLEKNKQNDQFKEYQELLYESLEKIIKSLKNIFNNENAILEIENIIRQYFPIEYKIGKEKEELSKKQINFEKKIKEQRGSQGEIYNEKNIKSIPEKNIKKNNTENNNQFKASNSEENQHYETEEENPFDFPNSENSEKKEKNQTQDNNDINKKDNLKQSPSENDETIKLQNYKKNNKKRKEEKQEKTEEKKISSILLIEKILKEINNNIDEYKDNHPANLFNLEENKNFITEIEKKLTELELIIPKINKEELIKKSKNNPFIKSKQKTNKSEIEYVTVENDTNAEYINNELQKIKLLNIDITTDPLPQGQNLIYLFEDTLEKIKQSFNNKTRPKDFEYIKNTLKKIEDLLLKYKNQYIKNLNTEDLPYWLKEKKTIEEEIANKKKPINNKKE